MRCRKENVAAHVSEFDPLGELENQMNRIRSRMRWIWPTSPSSSSTRRVLSGTLLSLLAAVLSGCGDDGTGPSANIAGTWAYVASLVTNRGQNCTPLTLTLTLQQSGESLSGSYTGESFLCTGSSGSVSMHYAQGTVSGSVDGNRVTIHLDGDSQRESSGTASGNTISGDVSFTETGFSPPITFTGSFSATKP